MTWARILLLSECFEGATPWDFFLLCGPIGTALPKAPLSCLSQGPSRNGYQRVWTVYCSFLERSVGNVRHFFWLLFRMTWTRILLLFECFEGATPWDFFLLCRPLGTALPKAPLSCLSQGPSRNGYQRVWTVYCSFLERSVGNVRHFFWLLFRMTWARILLLFECFESATPWDFFLLWACRNRFAKGTALMLVSRPFSQRLPTCLDGLL